MTNATEKSCTWCGGKGYLIKRNNGHGTNRIRWLLILVAIVTLTIFCGTGEILSERGSILLLLGVFVVIAGQFTLDFFDVTRLFFGKKEPCPHCQMTKQKEG